MSRINIWIIIAILLALFAVTRYLMHERETSLICANDPSAPACQREASGVFSGISLPPELRAMGSVALL
jgi:hypothetical protein